MQYSRWEKFRWRMIDFKRWLMRITLIELLIVLCIAIILMSIFGFPIILGEGAFGKTSTIDCTVQRLYVDGNGKSSHYMVGTDKGVFEVGNGLFINIWNADEIYSSIKSGESYRFTTKGNKALGMFWQYYPFIVKVEPLPKPDIPYNTVPGKE